MHRVLRVALCALFCIVNHELGAQNQPTLALTDSLFHIHTGILPVSALLPYLSQRIEKDSALNLSAATSQVDQFTAFDTTEQPFNLLPVPVRWYWAGFHLTNRTATDTSFIVSLSNHFFVHYQVWYQREVGAHWIQLTGNGLSQQPFHYNVKLNVLPGRTAHVVWHVGQYSYERYPALSFATARVYEERIWEKHTASVMTWCLATVLVAFALYKLAMFLAAPRYTYMGWLALTNALLGAGIIMASGSIHFWMNDMLRIVPMNVTYLTFFLGSQVYLAWASSYISLRTQQPAWWRMFRKLGWMNIAITGIILAITLTNLTPHILVIGSLMILPLLVLPLIYYGALILEVVKGIRAARYLFISSTPLVVMPLVLLFTVLDQNLLHIALPFSNWWFEYQSQAIGLTLVVEALLFSLAVADRLNTEQRERQEAQLEVLRMVEEQKETLEQRVEQRTQQLSGRTHQLISALDDLEKKNTNIHESIAYASRIQSAMLPHPAEVRRHLPGFALFFRPRNVVSGDFYWFCTIKGKSIIAAVDCTGHGVPGAFMSMLGFELLNRIVEEGGETDPGRILTKMHQQIRLALRQQHTDSRDGMDASVCTWEPDTQTLTFAGANHPMLLVHKNDVQEVRGDKVSIGGLQMEEKRQFQTLRFVINEPTYCYLFSDGYADQFGGERRRKLGYRKLYEALQQVVVFSPKEQERRIAATFDEWRGKENQLDDVLLLGFQVGIAQRISPTPATLQTQTA